MQCEHCQQREATIRLTQVIDGQVQKLNLCSDCADAVGFNMKNPISITDILMGLSGPTTQPPPLEIPSEDKVCPLCNRTRKTFKSSGRLGCPHCYEVFAQELEPLLEAMQHSTQHVGKIPAHVAAKVRLDALDAALQRQLEDAIRHERYEDAARIRDQLRDLHPSDQVEPS